MTCENRSVYYEKLQNSMGMVLFRVYICIISFIWCNYFICLSYCNPSILLFWLLLL
eukprot:UN02076